MIQSKIKQAIISCVMTNSLEWYGLALYGFFSSIIGAQFFHCEDPYISNILSLSVFSLGIISRPIGAIIFGKIGDKFGRKRALYLTLYLVAVPTTIMGLLPTYEQIGISAGIILMLLFICQGVGIGGGFAGSLVVLYEHSVNQKEKQSFICSWGPFSLVFGFLLAAVTGYVITHLMSHDTLYSWGWRIPFFLGLSGNLIGKYITKKLTETSTVQSSDAKPAQPPFRELFHDNLKRMLTVIWVDTLVGFGYFFLTVFIPSYFITILKFVPETVHGISFITMSFFCCSVIFGGFLADKYGKTKIMIIASIGLAVVVYPVFTMFANNTVMSLTIGHATLLFFYGIYFAQIPPVLSSVFPQRIRFLGVSLSHNIAMAVFGAPAPILSNYIIKASGNLASPAILLAVASLASTWAIIYYKNKYNKE